MFDYIDEYEPPDDAGVIAIENRTDKVCTFSRRHGNGKAILIGFKLKYVWDAHLDHKAFIHRILAEGGIERSAYSHTGELVVKERAGGGLGDGQTTQRKTTMNLIMICIDTLRYDHARPQRSASCNGTDASRSGREIKTPNLDAFAREAVVFDNAYTGSLASPCTPGSRWASMP